MWYVGEIVDFKCGDLTKMESHEIRAFRILGSDAVMRVWLGEVFESALAAYLGAMRYKKYGGKFAPCYI